MPELTPEELKAQIAELQRQLALAQAQHSAQVSGSGAVAAQEGIAAGQRGAALGSVRKSVVVTGDNASVKQIINYYSDAGGESSDPERLRRQIAGYLNWVLERFGTIELRGIKREGQQVVQLDLETVYVPLEAMHYGERKDVRLDQVLGLGNRLIITGGPGCGKTTVLQHIAWTLAVAIAHDDRRLAHHKLGFSTESAKVTKTSQGPIASIHQSDLPLPIFVPLGAFAQHLQNLSPRVAPRDGTLAAFVSHYLISKHTGLNLPVDFFDRLLSTQEKSRISEETENQETGDDGHPVILLLDGLDEVPSESERVRVRQAIEDLVSGRPKMQVVVTCRTAAYRERTALGRGFVELRVQELDADAMEALVRQAYAAIYRDDPDARTQKADELMRSVDALEEERVRRLGKDTTRLITSPLLVRMLLVVHYSERRLPEQRAELYMKATDAMLLPEYVLDEGVATQIGGLVGGSREAHRDLAQHVAFAMHRRGATQGREIEEKDLRRVLSENSTFAQLTDDFITLTRLRGTLLEERLGTFRFIHLAFQEYLTARWLAEIKRGEEGVEGIATFLETGPIKDSWWREPAMLVVGYLSVNSPQTAQSLVRRLAGIGTGTQTRRALPSSDVRVAATELAAAAALEWSALPDMLRTELSTSIVSIITGSDLMTGLRPSQRVSVADILARLGDPRFRTDAWYLPNETQLGFVEIPAGTFWMGSDPTKDRFAEPTETPQHQVDMPTFYIARYPVTVAQFRAFVQASGYRPIDPESLRGQPHYPVTRVTWSDAASYCDWLTKTLQAWTSLPQPLAKLLCQQGWRVTLPTEAQ